MNKLLLCALIITFFALFSCSRAPVKSGVPITTATTGLMASHISPFPIYLTESLEDRAALEKKYTQDIFIIHTGHLLSAKLSKVENEKTLEKLKTQGINLVNLTLEDFAIADSQHIDFEKYSQIFLNSSVIDLSEDNLVVGKNIVPYYVHDGIAFIGLSDNKLDKKLSKEKYLISDYVLSILKIKSIALKTATPTTISSFIIIHKIGDEINEVMERLPPSFINSLAN